MVTLATSSLLYGVSLCGIITQNPDVVKRISQNNPRNCVKLYWIHVWWTRRGSNTRHLPCKGSALPAELRAHIINTKHVKSCLLRDSSGRVDSRLMILKVFSLIRLQLSGVCGRVCSCKPLRTLHFDWSVFVFFTTQTYFQRTGPNSARAPQPGGDCAFLFYSHALYHSYSSVFAGHSPVVDLTRLELATFSMPWRHSPN